MKANCVKSVNIYPKQINFRSEPNVYAPQNRHDEFVKSQKSSTSNKSLWIIGGIVLAGISAFLTHKAGWWGRGKLEEVKDFFNDSKFTKISEAKEYFEKLGIEIDFRGANDKHLDMLNRIKENIKQLKEMGVKKDKPDSITISDWKNREETRVLFAKRGSVKEEPPESGYYQAFTVWGKGEEAHILIDSNVDFNQFRHEMGHINHQRGLDSFWQSKDIKGYDFANKQLEILGYGEKIYSKIAGLSSRNILEFPIKGTNSRYRFPTENGEIRYIYPQAMIDRMQQETKSYDGGKDLCEQIAYVFEGLLQGKKFSDEVMLYYDFSGGARIPNLKIDGKTYDEYIESLYNNSELIQKLRENVIISKI